jgi:VWFA-related protein
MRNPRVHLRCYAAVCLGLLVSSLSVALAASPQATTGRFGQRATTDPNSSRTLVLLFDLTTQPTEAVERTVAAGLRWVEEAMTDRDRVAVVAVDARVRVVSDFTSNRDEVRTALRSASLTDPAAGGIGSLANTPLPNPTPDAREDVRLGSLATLCETLRSIPERKSIFYFSDGFLRITDAAPLRSVTNACIRANVSIYPVDARGLQAGNVIGAARLLQLP